MSVTPLFYDGFDKYADTAAVNAAYGKTDAAFDFVLDAADTPFGEGKCIEYPDANADPNELDEPYFVNPNSLGVDIAAVSVYQFAAYRFKFHGLAASDSTVYMMVDAASTSSYLRNLEVVANSVTGTLSIVGATGGAEDASEAGLPFADGEWHGFEAYWVRHDSAAACYVYLDGELVTSASGFDGRYSNSGYTWAVAFMMSAEGWKMDDFVYGSCTAPATDRLGAGGIWQVPILLVASDAGTNDFTPSAGSDHYAMVDDASGDGDTTYLESSSSGQAEEFGLATFASEISEVLALRVTGEFRSTSAGLSRACEMYIESGVTEEIVAGPFTITGTTYTERQSNIVTVDPDTAAAWTKSGAQAVKLGFRV